MPSLRARLARVETHQQKRKGDVWTLSQESGCRVSTEKKSSDEMTSHELRTELGRLRTERNQLAGEERRLLRILRKLEAAKAELMKECQMGCNCVLHQD